VKLEITRIEGLRNDLLLRLERAEVDRHPAYPCLAARRDGALSIEDLQFDTKHQRIRDARHERDVSDEIEWAAFGQRVLRQGHLSRIEEIAHQFHDVRRVLAFDPRREDGERIGLPREHRARVARPRCANNCAGGLVSPTVDYRPEGTSAIAFVLKGRALVDVPGGSMSCSVL
jgi:hypothetical protein